MRSHDSSGIYFASPGQINFQIPSGLALGAGLVSVATNGEIHSTGALEIASVSPGLFTADASGGGLAAALVSCASKAMENRFMNPSRSSIRRRTDS